MANGKLSREQMERYLLTIWQRQPLLHILHRIHLNARGGRLAGQNLHREVIFVLERFELETQIPVQLVPTGLVQRARGGGNLSSLRSRPGFLQIERQVFQDTDQLLTEVTHELAFHYARRGGEVPYIGEGDISALMLLENMISGSPTEVMNYLRP
jgi:hypothetical protein